MSTWQIFSDARNDFRWEISDRQLQKEEQCHAVSQQRTDNRRLPSMADLLLLGCSKLVENGTGDAESSPMFRTGSGKCVEVKQSSIARARSVLGAVEDAAIDPGRLDPKENAYSSSKPISRTDSLKSVGVLKSGLQSASGNKVDNASNSMFQTASGKTFNVSSAGLLRAKTLLGLDEHHDQEFVNGFEQNKKQSTLSDQFAWGNPSHLEAQDPSNFNMRSSNKGSSSSVKSGSCIREPMKFPDFMNPSVKPSPVKFLTAGGRSISVSNDALQRARNLLGNTECDSFFNEASTTDNGTPNCESNPKYDFSTPFSHKQTENGDSSSITFTSPPTSHSHRKQSFGKPQKLQLGSNLISQFDAEANVNSSNRPCNVLDSNRKTLKNKSYSGIIDSEGSVHPNTDPSKRSSDGALVDISNTMNTDRMDVTLCLGEKKRLQRFSSVSPFKKPRGSFVTPLKKNNNSANKDFSRLALKVSSCKQRISMKYPFRVSRAYLKEYLLGPPSLQKELENLSEFVKRIDPVAAESYTFSNEIPSDCNGPEAFYRMLCQIGASTQYLTKEWMANHYKWIIWKLASYERCYPSEFAGKLLTVSNVLEELRYRYEREVNHGHRSPIKKVLDGDVPPSSMMVLCISSVGENQDPNFRNQYVPLEDSKGRASRIELTDGWYSVKALLDEPLSQKLASGKLFLGQKLRISGAKLNGWVGPISPFQASETSLLLHMNGTYRCHWAERLGLCKHDGVPLAFRCIKETGGAVPSTLIGVTRIYPLLYKERLVNGSYIVRSERVEAKALQLYNQRRDAVAEGIISAFQRETEFDVGGNHESEEGAKLMKLLETAAEPELLMAAMSSKQLSSFASYKSMLEAMKQSEMQKSIEKAVEAAGLNEREVTPFLRIKVVGLTNKFDSRQCSPQNGMITVWNPTRKQTLELCEGQAYVIEGLVPSRFDSGTLYLQARGSTSHWLPLSSLLMENFKLFLTPRSSTVISNLGKVPLSSEFDIAAFVVYVGEVYRQGHQQKQWIFVTDGPAAEFGSSNEILAINFCLPCVEFNSCLPVNSNITGSVVGFVNLTKRPRDQVNGLCVAEATENSDYFLSYDQAGRTHLKGAAASVLKWANTSSLMIEKLKKSVMSIIRNPNGR